MVRRTSAVLAADMVGYSRLVHEDEESTLDELAFLRSSVFQPKTEEQDGEIVKDMGDGWLAVFPSAQSAVKAAISIQAHLSGHPTVKLRMGIHLSDIVLNETDVFGDGVNVAARLEALSAPGGLIISEPSWRSLSRQMGEEFQDLGSTTLKNIDGTHRLYGWGASSSVTFAEPGQAPIGLAEMPTIAILPFDNLSGDPSREHLADGLTENLIAILSTSPNVMVTARNSSFVFKGKATPISEIAQALGVRYVVEGSLQAHGDKIRVTVQLIDAVKGSHLWAERYDRTLEDIFEVQDEIAFHVCLELHVKLTYGVHVRYRCKDIESLTLYTVGRTHYNYMTPQGLQVATEAWTKFHEKDTENPEGLCLMGWLHWMRAFIGLSEDPVNDLSEAKRFAEASISRDPNWGNGYRLLGQALLSFREFDAANSSLDKAIELNPSDGEAISIAGSMRCFSGRYEEAEALWLQSLKLEPFAPTWIPQMLATVRFILGKYELARTGLAALSRSDEETFAQGALAWLVILECKVGNIDEARKRLSELRSRFPAYTVQVFRKIALQLWKDQEMAERYAEELCRAGLPSS
ncbi:adenylate/guanylate cyclase domain-containing protein [Marimonas sp. MJW-29]|uniref:Adenylate/guanylate cyclase domain-containing protein n=1 Tax=Sulfitobacter sediminis TaxID=3234186 RepID=A0ABV3RST2_9RHOB